MRARHQAFARSQLLAARAAQMRTHLSPAESALWEAIRARRLGVLFRRQVLLAARFIADFLAPSARLIVEVDGRQHEQRRAADARRARVRSPQARLLALR